MDVKEWTRELIEDEIRGVKVEKRSLKRIIKLTKEKERDGRAATYESKTKHPHCTDGVKQHAEPKNFDVNRADNQIVHKISRRERCNQSARSRISIDPLSRVHRRAFLVGPHEPQAQNIDTRALDKRHDVRVPVDLGPAVERWVGLRKQLR